ncbi:Endonuclease/Exonuclease/phosphatase family protein [Histomonas meleagridis]|uniref:Endonuclease/Exonuclease/phosphatase family protein n=1 Tax=Histomonas meleagridis TaxID=135588 RepID=UPI003559D207|nr:Endonuclease/Exonuclease/phosphatase family protein [Histomonas meleagridis]KAH0804283.1 Endonuclease/Exonuclease/phosphatase family protein [Histomonas meleagridis]
MAATPGRAFATPILTSKTHYDLWEKQVLLNNASYVTKPRILRVAFLTWNVASVKPHPIVIEEISHAFQIGDSPTDIIFIALEEIDMGVVSVVKGSSKVKDLWSKIISITLSKTGGYHLKSELSLGGVYTALIMRNGLSPEPVCGDVKTIRLGAHGLAANKGAIMYPFTIGGTRFTFMGCHLSPHQENWQSRDQQLRNLLKLADKNFDFLAIIGDLNYRIEMTYEECISFISQKDADTLYLRDQLQISRNNDPILRRFKEPKITFFPTFKFDKESDVYDTSPKHRVPSYTDRVLLVRGRKRLSIGTSASPILDQKPDIQLNFPSMPKCVTYKSGVCKFSDHRSVLCGYKFIIPDIDVQKLMDLKEAIKNRISELQKQLIPTCTVSNQNIILDSNPKSFKLINTSKAWAQWQINYDKETVKVLPDNGVLLPNMEIEINVAMINVDQGKLEIEIARGNKIEIKLARGGILIGTSGSNVMNQNKNLEQWMFG